MGSFCICRCGSGLDYQNCCAPFHDGLALPVTAEALMRSRFSAYCLRNASYLLATWDDGSRPAQLDFAGDRQHWLKLEVLACQQGEIADAQGVVEFNAYFIEAGRQWLLHECSRFLKKQGCWFYLDGVVDLAPVIGKQAKIGANTPCPCGSGKKFKRCCGDK